MPNWCLNEVYITGPVEIIKEIVESKLELQKLFPCPEALKNTSAPAIFNDKEKYEVNMEKYGSGDWYDWQVKHWGTKWDIGPLDDLNFDLDGDKAYINATFDSAWSPPVAAFKKLFEKYKDKNISITLDYFEPGCAFIGRATGNSKDGFYDDYYDYHNSKDLEEILSNLEDHNLGENEIDYLKEREAEEAAQEIQEESKSQEEVKTLVKKSTKKATKKVTKKPAKKVTKKPAKKVTKKPAKKSTKKAAKKASKTK